MYIKLIHITTTRDRKAGFLVRQRQWNAAMAACPGFVDALVASDSADEEKVVIITVWRDKASLDEFMAGDHDLIERQSGIREFYDHLQIDYLNVEPMLHPSSAGHVLFGEGLAGLVELSESYRASAILRAGVVGGVFERVGDAAVALPRLANLLGVSEANIERLCFSLSSMGLMTIDDDGIVRLSEIARRHLVQGGEGYLGHLVVHNTRPELWSRWGSLTGELGLADTSPCNNDHEQFLAAMCDVAVAGQARQLLDHIDLSGRQHLLDIGGALGDYAAEIVRSYPEIVADVLDLPQSRGAALAHIETMGLGERLQFIAGDYREALPGNDYDVVLLANILRGEKREDAEHLLESVYSCLRPGGVLLLYDLFCDTPAGHSGLLAGFFGLHLPEAINPSSSQACEMLVSAGFVDVSVTPMESSIVANQLITAFVPIDKDAIYDAG